MITQIDGGWIVITRDDYAAGWIVWRLTNDGRMDAMDRGALAECKRSLGKWLTK